MKFSVNKQNDSSRQLVYYPATVLLLLSLVSCSDKAVQKLQGFAQGTTYHISYWQHPPGEETTIKAAVESEFAAIDKLVSNYRPDSTIEIFNNTQNFETFNAGPDIVALVTVARWVHEASQGCYDLTIKPLFDLWGFQNEKQSVPVDTDIQKKMLQVGMSKLEVLGDVALRKRQADLSVDLSSIAQGYSVEQVSRVLEAKGVSNYLVEIGGELKTRGRKPDGSPWRIAVERPLPGEQSLHKVVTMPLDTPLAVMTSGTYRHYFDANGVRYSHILDARTGVPVKHDLVSVTVFHPDPVMADAWSTALLCLGQKDGIDVANKQSIAALFIQQQGQELIESRSDPLNKLKTLAIH